MPNASCWSVGFVSIHAPPKGRDATLGEAQAGINMFQSTRPRRGATSVMARRTHNILRFQSTRPRRGATTWIDFIKQGYDEFQSTRPRRGATMAIMAQSISQSFNPRAPEGARQNRAEDYNATASFNPRAPEGARLVRPGR